MDSELTEYQSIAPETSTPSLPAALAEFDATTALTRVDPEALTTVQLGALLIQNTQNQESIQQQQQEILRGQQEDRRFFRREARIGAAIVFLWFGSEIILDRIGPWMGWF